MKLELTDEQIISYIISMMDRDRKEKLYKALKEDLNKDKDDAYDRWQQGVCFNGEFG